jgi:hypothetical protein
MSFALATGKYSLAGSHLFGRLWKENAQMAKLVDALCSGRSVRKGVQVRILFWAQKGLVNRRFARPFWFWAGRFSRFASLLFARSPITGL